MIHKTLWKQIGSEKNTNQDAPPSKTIIDYSRNHDQINDLDLSQIQIEQHCGSNHQENYPFKETLFRQQNNNISELLDMSFKTSISPHQGHHQKMVDQTKYKKIREFCKQLLIAFNQLKIELINIKENFVVNQLALKQSISASIQSVYQHIDSIVLTQKTKISQQVLNYESRLAQLNDRIDQLKKQNDQAQLSITSYQSDLESEKATRKLLETRYAIAMEVNDQLTIKCTKLAYELEFRTKKSIFMSDDEQIKKYQQRITRATTVGSPTTANVLNPKNTANKPYFDESFTVDHLGHINISNLASNKQLRLGQQFLNEDHVKSSFVSSRKMASNVGSSVSVKPDLGNIKSRVERLKRQLLQQMEVVKGDILL